MSPTVGPTVALWRVALASAPPGGGPPGSERGEEFGKTSPIALVVILLLGLATALLIRSMSKRLRNVPASFDDIPDVRRGRAARSGTGPDGGGAAGPDAERIEPGERGAGRTPPSGPPESP